MLPGTQALSAPAQVGYFSLAPPLRELKNKAARDLREVVLDRRLGMAVASVSACIAMFLGEV